MKKFLQSFKYAAMGILAAMREQRNLKVQVAFAIMTIVLAIYCDITATEWSVLLLAISLVIGLELVNSAIENLVDLVTRERHPLAGKAKDMAAGAVLFASALSVVIGVVIFYKYLFAAVE